MIKLFVLFLVFIGAAYLLVAFNYSYSDGNRAGYIPTRAGSARRMKGRWP